MLLIKINKEILSSIICVLVLLKFTIVEAQSLVDVNWLEGKACDDNLIVLEVHRGKKDYELAHIPCSVYTNFYKNGWRESRGKVYFLLPSVTKLVKVVEDHGISNKDRVIIASSGRGKYSAAEAAAIYYTLKYLGHNNVSILDGGVPSWNSDWNRDTETDFEEPKKGRFVPNVNNDIYADKDDVLLYLNKKQQLIDARSSDKYLGINSSSDSMRKGTIPGAINIPNIWLLKNNTLYFHNKDNLKKIFDFSGIKSNEPLISFCDAGLESALMWFVSSEILENPNAKLYESSLSEWSVDTSLPMISKLSIKLGDDEDKVEDSFSMKPD